jgi:hypothetical protein
MCQSRSTIFPGILIFVIFKPMDMQEYIFMFSIALEWTVNSILKKLITSKNHISEYFPLELKFRVFPGNYHWEFPGQP